MNSSRKIKYGILVFLFIVTVIQNIHFFNFCQGMYEGLLFAVTSLLFISTFLVIQLRDLYFFFKLNHFKNNILILEDVNIEQKTDQHFTEKYELIADTILKPFNENFDRIILKKK